MKRNFVKFALLLTVFMTGCSNKQITCIIRGKVIGVYRDTIMLIKATDDIRFAKIMIPIKDSLFEYKLVLPKAEAYYLIYLDDYNKGSMRPILIFPENGKINCTLFPSVDFRKNQISGALNKEYKDYQKSYEEISSQRYKSSVDSLMVLRKRDEY